MLRRYAAKLLGLSIVGGTAYLGYKSYILSLTESVEVTPKPLPKPKLPPVETKAPKVPAKLDLPTKPVKEATHKIQKFKEEKAKPFSSFEEYVKLGTGVFETSFTEFVARGFEPPKEAPALV
jgi:hypothetical protein